MVPDQKLALLDWDNTLRPGFTLTDWVNFLVRSKRFNPWLANDIAELVRSYSKGTASYPELSEKAPHLYAQGLGGQSATDIGRTADRFVRLDRSRLFPFTVPFLHLLDELKLDIHIVSGCPHEVLVAYVRLLGQGTACGLIAEQEHGFYTGRLAANYASAEGKKSVVAELLDGDRAFLAAGDSESDLPLFENAQIRLVFGNPGLLAFDKDAWHLDPTAPPAEVTDTLNSLIREGSRSFDDCS
jgi:phosphoserine phosphatase